LVPAWEERFAVERAGGSAINDTAAESSVGDVRAVPARDEDFGNVIPQRERKPTADEAVPRIVARCMRCGA